MIKQYIFTLCIASSELGLLFSSLHLLIKMDKIRIYPLLIGWKFYLLTKYSKFPNKCKGNTGRGIAVSPFCHKSAEENRGASPLA